MTEIARYDADGVRLGKVRCDYLSPHLLVLLPNSADKYGDDFDVFSRKSWLSDMGLEKLR